MSENADILLLFPSVAEIPSVFKPTVLQSDIVYPLALPHCKMICVGPGPRLRHIVPTATENGRGDLLVLLGYAGAIGEDLRCGDLVICDKFLAPQCPPLEVTVGLRKKIKRLHKQLKAQKLTVRRGTSYTAAAVVTSEKDKLILKQQGAMVVEMENYWAMHTARQLNMELLVVRVVLDTFSYHLPDLNDTLTTDGQISTTGILLHLTTHPWHLPAMLKLSFIARLALSSIEQCCHTIASCPGLR